MNACARGIAPGLWVIILLTLVAPGAHASGPTGGWASFARAASRVSVIEGCLPDLSLHAWTRATDASGLAITFHGQSGVVLSKDSVFAIGRVTPPGQGTQWRLFCFSRDSGTPGWAAPIPAPVLESWSSPCYDVRTASVYVASGSFVTCINAQTGQQRWQTPLGAPVVNASPLVTDDLGHSNRLFITDFSTGGDGRLLCLNVDAFHAVQNPHQPGAIVWSAMIGSTSGNTPAYLSKREGGLGLVYVSTSGDFFFGPGELLAFPADASVTPSPAFVAPNPEGHGYYGGVCVTSPASVGQDPALYAASYHFWGGLFSSSLVRHNARTGELAWSIASNRTSTTPVPISGGYVLVSGGVSGFGSVPSITLYKDNADHAQRVWDSALDSWIDANSNGVIDPGEYLRVGGWSIQPACVIDQARRRVFVGVAPSGASAYTPCAELVAVDYTRSPSMPGFVVASVEGVGASPAIDDGTLLSIGAQGLRGIGYPTSRYDVNADGRVSIDDLYAWEQGVGVRDVNADGAINETDRALLVSRLRAGEWAIGAYDG